MAFRLGNSVNNSARRKSNDATVDTVDFGTTNSSGRILFYTGTQPATPETTATGTLLATVPFAVQAFSDTDSNGTATLFANTPISATIAANGTAGWFRVIDRNSNPIMDGNVGTTGTDMIFDNVAFTIGGTLVINAFTITTPM